jgi:hypothetical protein
VETIVIEHKKSGYRTAICPFDEDIEYWYVIENRGSFGRYPKVEFDFVGEK